MDVDCTNMENFHQIRIIKTKGHPVRNLECEENNFGINEKVLLSCTWSLSWDSLVRALLRSTFNKV